MIKKLTLKILLFSLYYNNLCNFYFTLDFIEPLIWFFLFFILCVKIITAKRRNIMNDTIAAISTALGVGAISIIRVSGPDSIEIVNKL